jgi:glycosyltransferase involved in cell wall biosynthesis
MQGKILILRAAPIRSGMRVEKIGRTLVQAGYEVKALGWNFDRTPPSQAAGEQAGFPVLRLAVPPQWSRRLGPLPHLLAWQAALLYWLGQHRSEFDLIHACDFDSVRAALWARRLWGKKVVYDIFDLSADRLRAGPGSERKSVGWLSLNAASEADAVILTDDYLRPQLAGSHPRRLEVIYNALEDRLAELRPPPQQDGRDPGLKLRLVYNGPLQVERGLLPLLDVLATHPEWRLDLAGEGAERGLILAEVRRLANVTHHGLLPQLEALQLMVNADALPIFYNPTIPNQGITKPDLLLQGMMLGRPVLVAYNTGFDRLVQALHCGLAVDYGDTTQLEWALRSLENDDLRQRLGQNARRAYEETYSWSLMAERLLAFYQSLL